MASSLPLLVLLLCSVGLTHSYLRVYNLGTRNLQPDKFSRPDGYVKVCYGPSMYPVGQTSVVWGNRNPSWSDGFSHYSARLGGRLTLRVYNKNFGSDVFLGSCWTAIRRGTSSSRCNLSSGGTLYFTYSFS